MTPEEKDFHLKEFECLRKEIELVVSEFYNNQRYVVLGTGAVWAWLYSNDIRVNLAWAIPVLFAVLGVVRHQALLEQLKNISKYIQKIEAKIFPGNEVRKTNEDKQSLENLEGYETWFRSPESGRTWRYAGFSNSLVWVLLGVSSVAMIWLGPCTLEMAKPPVGKPVSYIAWNVESLRS